jgi:hypothetical protein
MILLPKLRALVVQVAPVMLLSTPDTLVMACCAQPGITTPSAWKLMNTGVIAVLKRFSTPIAPRRSAVKVAVLPTSLDVCAGVVFIGVIVVLPEMVMVGLTAAKLTTMVQSLLVASIR